MTDPVQPTEPAAPQPMSPPPMTPPPPPTGWGTPAAGAPAMMAGGPRPTGATVISVIAGIEGVLIALFGLLAILGTSLIGGAVGSSGAENAGAVGGLVAGVGIVVAIIAFLIAALYLAIAIGVWRARSWSWILGVVVYIIVLVFGVLGLTNFSVYGAIVGVVLPAVVLFLFWQPDVKRYLGRA